jgi:hypothetical protein
VDRTSTYPTDSATLHLMLREQQQLIESLNATLHRLLKWRSGPKSESIDVDQFGLFADGSLVIEVPVPPEPEAEAGRSSASSTVPSYRRRAVRVLKNLRRVIEQINVPEGEKSCPCCGERMSSFGHESSDRCTTSPPGSRCTRRSGSSIPVAIAMGRCCEHNGPRCRRSP